jgi:hypothetical protein
MIYDPSWGLFTAFALLMWVPFGLWLFTIQRPTRAGVHVLVWGMMWLPEAAGFDFPALPPLDKYSISALVALAGVWWKAPQRLKLAKRGRGYDLIAFAMIAAIACTVYNNGQPLRFGTYNVTRIQAFAPYDGLSAGFRLFFNVVIPLWLGRALLRTREDMVDTLKILVISGLIYSVPILYELRMSPMLHQDVYGFQSRTDWLQNIRSGGFRATAFMGHGLIVAFFMFMSTASAIVLHKSGQKRLLGIKMWVIITYMFGMLVVCKTSATLIYGAAAFALIRWTSVKTQTRAMILASIIVAAYPASRMFEVFPVKGLMSAAQLLGPERTQSMQFRFDNEDVLLVRGAEHLWFGWGGFGRERVYDKDSGKDLVIQDGYWIIIFGQQGVVGFICFFALMLIPVCKTRYGLAALKGRSDKVLLTGFGVLVLFCAINMLPNMAIPNIQLFLASGLAVLIRTLPRQAMHEKAAASSLQFSATEIRATVVYNRPVQALALHRAHSFLAHMQRQ